MHSGYKLHVVTFGTKRRRSLGNVCKHRSMERSGVKCFHYTHVFDPLSLLEGLNSPCDNNASAALWKREPISDDYFPRMDKAVLSISGNVYKQQEMEIGSGVKCFHYTHVFDLTNLKGEKRRNVGKLNNKLSIVNQLVDLHFLQSIYNMKPHRI
jgi:hypothetical protein